uniref:Uncharacterized protein n=1 Tax=Lactuca sativa TaxID=4236 RepID=A0A9R1UV59_LACSA|nr:hypothetical protein LSAT_V11C800434150 [Lactuca sativa]
MYMFLAKKTSRKDVCDYKIKGSWSKRNCTVSMGDTSTTITQVNKIQSSENIKFIKVKFMVTIYPNVDYAFVVTLIAIVEAMKSSNTKGEVAAEVTGSWVAEVIGAIFS